MARLSLQAMKRPILILTLLPLLLAVGCAAPATADRPWSYADLRALLPAGDAPTPSADILAVYTRTSGTDLEIRIDLLDVSFTDDTTIDVFLTDDGNFAQHPLAIHIPAQGLAQAVQAGVGNADVQPRVIRDPWLDTVTIRLNRIAIGNRYRFDVYTYTAQSPAPADEARGITSDGAPPETRAALLLAFWDTLPATTPAQALRSWDGAHTGPNDGRHGLKLVLDAAEQNQVPVVLLDLKTPASLAALNYLSGTGQLQRMAERGLLILPDVAYGSPEKVSLNFSRRAADGFGLPASQFVYSPYPEIQSSYLAQFVGLSDDTHASRSGGTLLFPLPAANAVQATDQGPSLDIRRELVAAALSDDPSRLVVLGGDLPHSTWGDADKVAASFTWIAAHPWIRVLTGQDLLTFPIRGQPAALPPAPKPAVFPVYAADGRVTGWDSARLQSLLLGELQSRPHTSLTDLAWQAYLTLTATSSDAGLQALRAQYLWQIRMLLAASQWAEHPSEQVQCPAFTGDGPQTECILANERFFAVLEPEGARLTYLFYVDPSGAHELIGPTALFAVGLSDPSEWQPERGEAADPQGIPGAFIDDSGTWTLYRSATGPQAILFTSPDGRREKTYQLTEDGLQVTYHSQDPVNTRIPLAVDPQAFYFHPSAYQAAPAANSWTWGLAEGVQVVITTQAALQGDGFIESLPLISQPEDPNLDYPVGHYLPFPFAVVTLSADGDFKVQVSLK